MRRGTAWALALYTVGVLALASCWTFFAFARMQDRSKLWIVWLLTALSLVFAFLTLWHPTVFGALALVLPVITLVGIGSLLVILAVVQGMHAVSAWMLAMVLTAVLCLGTGVALLTGPRP